MSNDEMYADDEFVIETTKSDQKGLRALAIELAEEMGWENLTPMGKALVREEYVEKHLAGKHDQSAHGRKGHGGADAAATFAIRQLQETGGFSIRLASGFQPTHGYMVALPRTEEVLGDVATCTPAVVKGYVDAHKASLEQKGHYLGGWIDNGKVYLDISTRKQKLEDAIRIGLKSDQIAIQDLDRKESVYLKGPKADHDAVERALLTKGLAAVPIRFYLRYPDTPERMAEEIQRLAREGGHLDVAKSGPPCIDCGEDVTKHGSHDQRTHGHRGGGAVMQAPDTGGGGGAIARRAKPGDRVELRSKGVEPGQPESGPREEGLQRGTVTRIPSMAGKRGTRAEVQWDGGATSVHSLKMLRVVDDVEKGDYQGHPFRGNQHERVAAFGGKRSDAEEAVLLRDAIIAGKKVLAHNESEASLVVDALAKYAREAEAKGEKAKNFNLCKITVPGTNIFCEGNLGIPRNKMPQLSGQPVPGSKASKLPVNKKGEVDAGAEFARALGERGIKITEKSVRAQNLKATQSELKGPQVAGMMKAMEDGTMSDGSIFISNDGYVLDGHHRFAATVGRDLLDQSPTEYKIKVKQIDLPIEDLLPFSMQWTRDFGIAPKAAK